MTEGAVLALAVVLGAGIAALRAAYLRRAASNSRLDLRQAAQRAGVSVRDEKSLGQMGLMGEAGGQRVHVEELPTREGLSGTRVVIEGGSGITMSRETLRTGVGKALRLSEDVVLGDEPFDRDVYVRGSREIVRAVLDAEAREQWRRLLGGRIRLDGGDAYGFEADVSLRDGRLQADFQQYWSDKLRRSLAEVLAALLAIVRKLEPPADPAARIAENTRTEPEWPVRLENLRLLKDQYAQHPATREALRRGCGDESEDVRLLAAVALGDEGREALLAVASREGAGDSCAAAAVEALGDRLSADAALSVLDNGIRGQRTRTVLACIAALGRCGGPAAVERLADVLAGGRPDFAVAAAHALAATGDAAAEAPLVRALGETLADLQAAAAVALGRAGSAAAVLSLQEAASREGAAGALRRAARQSVAQIQSRLEGAAAGQVSLSEGEAGQLSLAGEDPSGRLSVPEPDHDA
jgi:HEAT repeat protein